MDCFYINLDSAEERRRHIEENFAARKKPDWTLTRFPAIDTSYVARNNVAGKTMPTQKACFFSHRVLMQERLGNDKTYLVMEDDAMFGARSCALMDGALERNRELEWDILFTDVCIANVQTMYELVKYRRELVRKNIDLTMLDLRDLQFAASTAYIVNGKSKRKIHEALSAYNQIDLPYDLYLWQLARRGVLKIYSLFPFVTTLSDFCSDSQIKTTGANPVGFALNMFRKMIWMERNLSRCRPAVETFRKTWCYEKLSVEITDGDEEMSAFMALFASMATIRG